MRLCFFLLYSCPRTHPPDTYQYENAHFSRNGKLPVSYKGAYSPDVTADKAYDFLEQALAARADDDDKPFFLGVAPIAPHANMIPFPYEGTPPKYAARHAHLFKDYKIPRTANFNPDEVFYTVMSHSLSCYRERKHY